MLVSRTFGAWRMGALLVLPMGILLASPIAAKPLKVVATVPDLASLAREVGGEEVSVESLAKGPQDPHFLEARPSFIRALFRTDLFAYVGLALESAWLPPLIQNARNARILPGQSGNFDASEGLPRRGVIEGEVDRSAGDVHPYGSPHYLLDPVMGLHVADALRTRLAELRPEKSAYFDAQYEDFAARLLGALVGAPLRDAIGAEKLREAALSGDLDATLSPAVQGPGAPALGGWLGRVAPHQGVKVVADHDLWPHFAARFGVDVVDFLEPKPGVAPTTRHLTAVAARMRAQEIRLILAAPYFRVRYAEKVTEASGGVIVPMTHQVGGRKGVDDYLSMIEWNVSQVLDAL